MLEVSNVIYRIFNHHEPIKPESECKSRVYFWIDSSFYKNRRMYESSSHEFYPAASFADSAFFSITIAKRTREIYLNSWLYKWKITRSEPD
jgi:hypothetical protein